MAEWLARNGSSEGLGQVVARVQRTRAQLSDIEEAVLHFWLLPARDDLRSLRRRVIRLRRDLSALDEELARIETLVEDDSP